MAKPYSQDLRDRVIEAVERGKLSRRAAARHYEVSESVAIKWLERLERHGSREPVGHGGHRASKLMPYRDFLKAARGEKSDITALAVRRAQRVVLCRRLRERAKSIPFCRSWSAWYERSAPIAVVARCDTLGQSDV